MMNDSGSAVVVWRAPLWIWLVGAVLFLLIGVIYLEGLKALVTMWDTKEEYSYGYMIPFISLFLIWQRKDLLERINSG